ncbi:MAG: hypothetical protein KIG68_04730 [Oxalobacter sp.]|nr:hypothetical protein [Oxalobacter sp.]
MDRKSWIVTLASATALLSAVGYFAFRKYRAWKRTPIAVLDVDAVVARSLPGRAAAQYLRTAKNILERNIDEVRKQYSERENTPEAVKAIKQAEAFAQQQTLIYQRKLDEEIQKTIEQAVRVWLAAHKNVTAVVPTDKTLGYNESSDITNDIMAEIRWYKPSFPPMPRPRGAS